MIKVILLVYISLKMYSYFEIYLKKTISFSPIRDPMSNI